MRGMHNTTGKSIDGVAHLRQRLADVLTTPKGTRVMRRGYGCDLFELMDQPMSDAWLVRCYAAIAEAVDNPTNGLPDFALERVRTTELRDDGGVFDLTGIYLPTGQRLTVNVGNVA